ncbi:hypothetical protein [Sphingobacterium sp. WOUb80]|uniref:hypothetical protein n=1 Tax=Sphingobacterium sp. WOUb80 TaxID=3234028 RepID=UPI003CFB8384
MQQQPTNELQHYLELEVLTVSNFNTKVIRASGKDTLSDDESVPTFVTSTLF